MRAQERPSELVRWILVYGTAAKLLAEHAADASGHCPRCPAGGSSSGRVKAPCTLFAAAMAAVKLGEGGSGA